MQTLLRIVEWILHIYIHIFIIYVTNELLKIKMDLRIVGQILI